MHLDSEGSCSGLFCLCCDHCSLSLSQELLRHVEVKAQTASDLIDEAFQGDMPSIDDIFDKDNPISPFHTPLPS